MSKSKKSKGLKKEVKKEIKAIKKAARGHPRASKALRKEANVIHGKGGYFGDLGSKVGNVLDVGAGLVKSITGLGEYKVKSNSLMVAETGRPPTVRNSKYSSTITGHPEYICDIVSSTDFSIQKFPINPGIPGTFPWLAPQAVGYEQYKPRGILFEFRSTCGDAIASTNNAMGVVIMGTEYNVALPPFANKQEMEDHEYTTSIKPSETALHPIECARSRTVLDDLYIRNGTEEIPDLKFYDLGNFYVATQGQQTAGVTLGELWVTYEFDFMKPALSSRTTNTVAQHWFWDSNLGTAPSDSYPLHNLREVNTDVVTPTIGASIPLPVGNYLAVLQITGTSLTYAGDWTFTQGAGVYGFTTNPSSHLAAATKIVLSSTTVNISCARFTINANGGFLSGVAAASAGTVATEDLWILPIGNSIEKSRRAVDYDPMTLMYNKVKDLTERLDRAQALWGECLLKSTERSDSSSSCEEDEKYVDLPSAPPSLSRRNAIIRSPEVELTRSQTNIATFVLDRLGVAPRAA